VGVCISFMVSLCLYFWFIVSGLCKVNVKCDEVLATPLAHHAFSASSVFASGYAAGYAKLNRRGGAGGWSPLDNDHYQWLQVDLGGRKQITAIATQGRYSSSDWTTQYRLLYSDTGRNWKPYQQDGNIWVSPPCWEIVPSV
uniref:F5/8 type C domain-containing protein n=1 Tax=Paramormyrops kingsleyae TaxID=1676925 RepID=A0A3B3QTJ0_9TELE